MNTVKQWDRIELTFNSTIDKKHFINSEITAIITTQNEEFEVSGFYDDNGVFIVRFMPSKVGVYNYVIKSNVAELNGITGHFECIINDNENIKGVVRVDETYHFKFDNNEPYYPFGTTAYVWNYQLPEIQNQTIETLSKSPFNKIRMCVFPKHYTYNFKEPEEFPFHGNIKDGFDFDTFNVSFFRKLEQQIEKLRQLKIEADIIIFHPYDRWGFSKMDEKVDFRYVKYLVSRLSSFSNVWWSLANEYDLLVHKSMEFWNKVVDIIASQDPYHHLISNHNWHDPFRYEHYTGTKHWYDHTNPKITHASIQHHDMWFIPFWREQFKKPIMIDECRYEGNVDLGWGNINAEAMTDLFWSILCAGGYATHGDSFLSEDDIIWWSHGGVLKGQSAARIAFLRQIIEEGPVKRLTPIRADGHWDTVIGHVNSDYYLMYFWRNSQPGFKYMTMLDEHHQYKVEIIDTWNMTIETYPEIVKKGDKVQLQSKQKIALRVTKI